MVEVQSPVGVDADFLAEPMKRLQDELPGIMNRCGFSDYIGAVLELATATNRYIDATEPFKLAKDPSQRERLGTILYACAEAVRIVLSYLEPFMPEKAAEGLAQLGVSGGESRSLSERGRFGLLEASLRKPLRHVNPAGLPVSAHQPAGTPPLLNQSLRNLSTLLGCCLDDRHSSGHAG